MSYNSDQGQRMKKRKNRRLRMIADWKIQGGLLLRLAIYWVTCQLAVVGTMAAFAMFLDQPDGQPAEISRFLLPSLVVSSLVLPIVMLDMAVFSNRFVGPMFQFRQRLKKMAESANVQEVNFRKGDYYTDLKDHFNQLSKILNEASSTEEKASQPKKKMETVA